MSKENNYKLILDIGTETTKFGRNTERPSYIMKSCVGRLRTDVQQVMKVNKSQEDLYSHLGIDAVGDECIAGIHNITNPIENGQIKDWKGVEAILINCFHHLTNKTTIENNTLIITDSIYGVKQSRFELAHLIFKVFGAKALYINYQPFFSLYSMSCKNSGIIVEIGDGMTQIYPCIGGHPLRKGMRKYPFGGSMITEFLFRKYNATDLNTKSHLKDVAKIKEKYSRVSFSFDEELENFESKKIEEFGITAGSELIEGPEMFFQSQNNRFEKSIQEIIIDSIYDCDAKSQEILFKNIILCGGVSATCGFAERLERELKLLEPDKEIHIYVIPNPSESAWKGASNFASLPNYIFNKFTVKKEEYFQYGNSIIDGKCFSLNSKNN